MTSLLIKNCRLYDACPSGSLCSVLVAAGVIEKVVDAGTPTPADRTLDARGRILAPGFIDVHIQGAGGADVLDATPQALETISRTCVRFGVTGFLATTVYHAHGENRHLKVAADCVGQDLGGAHLLGVHLEGPFIAPEKKGMILPQCLTAPSPATLEKIRTLSNGKLRMMTIAPEQPGSLEIIEALVADGVIASFGHSRATYEEALRGFEAGITHVTHLFNAMAGLHHRTPGPLAAIFERPQVTCQVIADGVHIHPSVLRLTLEALGPKRFITITDGMQAMGLPDGRYVYNGLEYESRDGTARYEDGTLIGTALGLNEMLARLVRFTGCSLADAIRTASVNPAAILGLGHRKGRVAPGYDADLVILDTDLSVHATLIAGRLVHEGSSAGGQT